MFFILSRNDNKGTYRVLDTDDLSIDIIEQGKALEYFKNNNLKYRFMLDCKKVTAKGYILLYYIKDTELTGVLIKGGTDVKVVTVSHTCTAVDMRGYKDSVKLIFIQRLAGQVLSSYNEYTKNLSLLDESQWRLGVSN